MTHHPALDRGSAPVEEGAGPLVPALSGFDLSPFVRFLGIRPAGSGIAARNGGQVYVLPFVPELIGNALLPALHGGVIGALLETVAIMAAHDPDSMDALPKTIDVNIDYLRSVRPRDLFAEARVLKTGRRIAVITAEAFQDDSPEPVAFLRGQFLLRRKDITAPDPSSDPDPSSEKE